MGHNELLLLKDSFILEKETVEGGQEKGAPWSLRCSPTVGTGMTSVAWKNWHSGHAHCTPLLLYPCTPSHLNPPPSFSCSCQFGCSAWPDELGPLPLFACETKPLRRKREEAESFTWYQPKAGMAASAFPSQAPLLAEKCWCDPSTPFSPSVPLTPPCNPFFSVPAPCSHPETALFSRESALNKDDMLRDLGWVISHDTTFLQTEMAFLSLLLCSWSFVWRGNSFPTHFPN